jgi:hypothetical protein
VFLIAGSALRSKAGVVTVADILADGYDASRVVVNRSAHELPDGVTN